MSADKLYVNGDIYTVDKDREWVEAVAVEGKKIVFAGDRADAEKYCGDSTEICETGTAILCWRRMCCQG